MKEAGARRKKMFNLSIILLLINFLHKGYMALDEEFVIAGLLLFCYFVLYLLLNNSIKD